jgi:predicted nucleotidyltransferase
MSIVFTPDQQNLAKQDRGQLIEALRSILTGKAESAYIFGSFATGNQDPLSDIDLIVVAQTALPFHERARQFDQVYEVWPRIDLLVYTPEEFERQLQNADQGGFWKSVKDSLVKIL